MRKPHPTLTPQELAIMKVVWRTNEVTVRDVHDALNADRPIAYTTVMTMMRILEGKGYLTKATHEKAHVYRPAEPQQKVIGGMVRDFLDRVFDGASDALLVHLARDHQLTARQKRIIRQLLDGKDEKGEA